MALWPEKRYVPNGDKASVGRAANLDPALSGGGRGTVWLEAEIEGPVYGPVGSGGAGGLRVD